jgi:uncharacterized membrane protein
VNAHDLGLLVHLLGVLLFFGGALVAWINLEAARRRDRPSEIVLLLGVARIGAMIVLAGTALTLGGGFWLAADIDQFGEAWLQLSLALFLVALVLGALGGQHPKRARRLARRLADSGDAATEELPRLLDDPLSLAANYVSSGMALVVLALMVWQPGR